MMVRYAGYDPRDVPFELRFRNGRPRKTKPERAYTMFSHGSDTAKIAATLKTREPTVLRWITQERSKALCLPDPYGRDA